MEQQVSVREEGEAKIEPGVSGIGWRDWRDLPS